MLVLSRKKDDQIVIGINGEIVVRVVEIIGDKVRLGIEAPSNVSVHRQEVYLHIQRENEAKGLEKKTGGLEKGVADILPSGNSEGPGSSYQPKLLYNKY